MESEKSSFIKIYNAAISTIVFLILAIITLVIFFIYERGHTKNIAKETFVAISENKTNQISDWYADEVNDARLISNNQFLLDLLLSYKADNKNYHLLVKFLNQIKTEHVYADVVVLTVEGKCIASTNAGLAFDDPLEMEFFVKAKKSKMVYVSDIYRSKIDHNQYIDFLSVVKSYDNQDIACLVFRMDPVPFLNEILVNWPMQHKTAQTFLVSTNVSGQLRKYINSNTISDCWVPYDSSGFNQKKVYSLNSGFVENGISDGKEVFSFTNVIPETPWGLVVEVDKNEIFSSVYSRMKSSIIFVIVICLLFFIITYYFIHLKQGKIVKRKVGFDSALSFHEKRFNLIMDMLAEGVIVTDDKGMIQYMNLKAETVLGWSFSEIKEKPIDDYFRLRYEDTGYIAFNYKNWQFEKSGLSTMNNVMLLEKDDRIIPVSCTITPIRSTLVNQHGLIVIFENQTEKRYQENVIHKGEMRFKIFFQDAPDATLIIDKSGIIRHANLQALLIFGYSMHELIGMKVENLVPLKYSDHAKFREDYFENPQKRSMGANTDVAAIKKNGLQFPIVVSLSPINDDDEQMVMAVIRDITKLKEYETELVAAKVKAEESEQLKTAFLANISHEIRTPLNGIIGFSTILLEEGLTSEEIKRYSELIGQSGERLLELLNNVIEISKLDSGVETVNSNTFIVSELVKSVYNQFIPFSINKPLDYRLSIPKEGDSLKIKTDSVKLGQILTNFLSNAFKFTNNGFIELGYTFDKEECLFYVKDTGNSIHEEHHEKIFERFFQSNATISNGVDGSGLGLAICKGYSDLLGGKIWFENDPDTGKTFFFKFLRTNK